METKLESSEHAIKIFVALLRTFESQHPGFLEIFADHWERIRESPDEIDLQMIQTFNPLVRFVLGKLDLEEAKMILKNSPYFS